MRGKRAEFCHLWLCSSGRNFLQLASYIVGKMRLKCKIPHEIEKRITDEESCLRKIFEKSFNCRRGLWEAILWIFASLLQDD